MHPMPPVGGGSPFENRVDSGDPALIVEVLEDQVCPAAAAAVARGCGVRTYEGAPLLERGKTHGAKVAPHLMADSTG